MQTKLRLTKISVQDMLARPEQEYNPTIWKDRVLNLPRNYKDCQFYVIEPDKESGYSYARFYVSYLYEAENLHFFREFDAFHSCLSNNGFCKVNIDENGFVHKFLFVDFATGKEGYAENTKENRKKIGLHVTPNGYMISNDI